MLAKGKEGEAANELLVVVVWERRTRIHGSACKIRTAKSFRRPAWEPKKRTVGGGKDHVELGQKVTQAKQRVPCRYEVVRSEVRSTALVDSTAGNERTEQARKGTREWNGKLEQRKERKHAEGARGKETSRQHYGERKGRSGRTGGSRR